MAKDMSDEWKYLEGVARTAIKRIQDANDKGRGVRLTATEVQILCLTTLAERGHDE